MTPEELRKKMLDDHTQMFLNWVLSHPAYEGLTVKEARRHADGLASMSNRFAQEFHHSMTASTEAVRLASERAAITKAERTGNG